MKKVILSLMMSLCLFEVAAQYRVSIIDATKDAVTMRCIGYGKKAVIASQDAELSAIKTVLFVGTSGEKHSQPLVQGGRQNMETKHQGFFDNLYNSEYRNFIESSVIVTPFGRNDLKQKCITLDVCVRVTQLKAYLENNGIIRKFGL